MVDFLERGDGIRLAYSLRAGDGPALVFLPGYASDMTGAKAEALDGWAGEHGRVCLRLDYSGCGASGGAFADGTLTQWRDDALLLIDRLTNGPLILVGSSMGGWIALMVALARPERIAGLIGIAAAPDFTDWGLPAELSALIEERGEVSRPSDYGAPLIMTRAFLRSAQSNPLLGGEIAIRCPVRLLQGQRDPDVPWEIALRLAGRLGSADVQTLLVKDGDHRLSRPQDIALLLRTVAALTEDP